MRMATLTRRTALLAMLAAQVCQAQPQWPASAQLGCVENEPMAVLPDTAWLELERLNIRGMRTRDTPLQSWPLYHYVHKAHAAVIPVLTQALQEMQKSGYLAGKQADFSKRLQQARRSLSGV